jgi:hypothetical protein
MQLDFHSLSLSFYTKNYFQSYWRDNPLYLACITHRTTLSLDDFILFKTLQISLTKVCRTLCILSRVMYNFKDHVHNAFKLKTLFHFYMCCIQLVEDSFRLLMRIMFLLNSLSRKTLILKHQKARKF